MSEYCDYNTRFGLSQFAAPATEPITTALMKKHLRVDTDDDDDYIDTLVAAARAHVESKIGKRLVTQTWDMKRDMFPIGAIPIMVPYGPVQSISSIIYVDTSGTSTTMTASDYTLDTYSADARLYPVYGVLWPSTRDQRNAVTIRYVTGYGADTAVPANILHAIKLLVGHWYTNRESLVIGTIVAELPQAVEALLAAERASWL